MSDIQTPETIHDVPISIVKSMVALSTSGFGLVVALAWNEFIRRLVDTYIAPYFGKASGPISQLIYAIGITVIAVLVTMQLAMLQRKLEQLQTKIINRKRKADGTPC